MNPHQLYGAMIAVAGLYATLCGFGVISRPKNTSDAMLNIYVWFGPLGLAFGVLYIFLRARS